MDDKYTKIDATRATIESVEKTVETVSLDQLNYDRKSLVTTQTNNTQDAINKNLEIDALIADIDVRIDALKKLGIVTMVDAVATGKVIN